MGQLISFRDTNPLRMCPDIIVLRLCFNMMGHRVVDPWYEFVIMYALGDPIIVEAYVTFGWEYVIQHYGIASGYRYRHVSSRSVQYRRPERIRDWDPVAIQAMADAIMVAVNTRTRASHTAACRLAHTSLHGVGVHSAEEMLRAAYMMDHSASHPFTTFLQMGEGSSKSRYEVFVNEGIRDITDFNAVAATMGLDSWVDAGELAYLVCMVPPIDK